MFLANSISVEAELFLIQPEHTSKWKRKQKRNGWRHLHWGDSRPSYKFPLFPFCFHFRFKLCLIWIELCIALSKNAEASLHECGPLQSASWDLIETGASTRRKRSTRRKPWARIAFSSNYAFNSKQKKLFWMDRFKLNWSILERLLNWSIQNNFWLFS